MSEIEISNYNAKKKYLGIKQKPETSQALVPKIHTHTHPKSQDGNYGEPNRKQRRKEKRI